MSDKHPTIILIISPMCFQIALSPFTSDDSIHTAATWLAQSTDYESFELDDHQYVRGALLNPTFFEDAVRSYCDRHPPARMAQSVQCFASDIPTSSPFHCYALTLQVALMLSRCGMFLDGLYPSQAEAANPLANYAQILRPRSSRPLVRRASLCALFFLVLGGTLYHHLTCHQELYATQLAVHHSLEKTQAKLTTTQNTVNTYNQNHAAVLEAHEALKDLHCSPLVHKAFLEHLCATMPTTVFLQEIQISLSMDTTPAQPHRILLRGCAQSPACIPLFISRLEQEGRCSNLTVVALHKSEQEPGLYSYAIEGFL